MKCFTKKNKALFLLFILAYFQLICIYNTAKVYSVSDSAIERRKKTHSSLKTEKKKKRISNHSRTFHSMSKKKEKNLLLKTKTKLKLFESLKNFAKEIIQTGIGIFNYAVNKAKKIFRPFVYTIKWVWEKMKTLLRCWDDVDRATIKFGMFLNNPVTYLSTYFYNYWEENINSDPDLDIAIKDAIVVSSEEKPKEHIAYTEEQGKNFEKLEEHLKINKGDVGEKLESKINFVKNIYMGFTRTILNEINPVSYAIEIKDTKAKQYLKSKDKSGAIENQSNRLLNSIKFSIVTETIKSCSENKEVSVHIASFIDIVLQTIKKYKTFFNALVTTLEKKPEEMKGENIEIQEDGKKKKIGVFSAIKHFTYDLHNVFSNLLRSFGSAFFECVNIYAETIANNVWKLFTWKNVILGALTIMTQFIDDAINIIPIWSQIRGLFNAFFSIYTLIKAPLSVAIEGSGSIKDINAGNTIGAYLGNFAIWSINAGLALSNVQFAKTIIKISISGFTLVYGIIRNKLKAERNKRKSQSQKYFRFSQTCSLDDDIEPQFINEEFFKKDDEKIKGGHEQYDCPDCKQHLTNYDESLYKAEDSPTPSLIRQPGEKK